MTECCHDCDKPLAGQAEHDVTPEGEGELHCWRAWSNDVCQWPRVDWRARCLELNAALTSVCDVTTTDAEHWSRVLDARGVLSKETT